MKELILKLYTVQECFDQAMPFRVNGYTTRVRLNPLIPKAPGIYILLDHDAVRYVGQTSGTIAARVRAYMYDIRLTWITWHLVDQNLLHVYESAYIDTLQPDLNGRYDHGQQRRIRFGKPLTIQPTTSRPNRLERAAQGVTPPILTA